MKKRSHLRRPLEQPINAAAPLLMADGTFLLLTKRNGLKMNLFIPALFRSPLSGRPPSERNADFIGCRADPRMPAFQPTAGTTAPGSFLPLTHLHKPPSPSTGKARMGTRLNQPQEAAAGPHGATDSLRLGVTRLAAPALQCPSPHQARAAGHGWAQGQHLPPPPAPASAATPASTGKPEALSAASTAHP